MSQQGRKTREKIATANIASTGLVDIYYIGGSTFEFDFQNKSNKPVRCSKDKLDSLLAQGKVTLTAPRRYDEITKSINEDGSTKDQNADGSPKSAINRTLDMLKDDQIIVETGNGKYEVVEDEDESDEQAPREKVFEGRDNQDDEGASAGAAGLVMRKPEPIDVAGDEDGTDETELDVDPFEDMNKNAHRRTERSALFAERKREKERRQALEGEDPFESYEGRSADLSAAPEKVIVEKKRTRGFRVDPNQDLNGDGKIDQFDAIEAERRSLGIPITMLLVLASLVGVVSFFGVHAMFEGITGDTANMWLNFGGQEQQTSLAPGFSNQENANSAENAGYEYVNRTDYDPEEAVRNLPMADDSKQTLCSELMRYLRGCVMDGNVDGFTRAVALDSITDNLAVEYANYAGAKQNLNEADRQLLYNTWREQFKANEIQHIQNHDIYATIFGGRIREVRQSDIDPYTLFVVMESVAGDHQRICFIVHGDASGAWAITGVNAPSGYIAMICEGRSF